MLDISSLELDSTEYTDTRHLSHYIKMFLSPRVDKIPKHFSKKILKPSKIALCTNKY